jgi:G3E family GTPase
VRLLATEAFADAVVIINAFGEVSIDQLTVANLGEMVVGLRNGCLCCTVREDLLMTLSDLHRRRLLGEIKVFNP